jgi:hypothetical protein
LDQLAGAFGSAFADTGRAICREACRERLDRSGDALAALASDLVEASGARAGIVLFVDQAEQLATQSPANERIAFLNMLNRALAGRSQLRAVATLRSEYLSDVVASTAFEGQAVPAITVGRLSPGRLAAVIDRPARRAGLEFDAELVRTMVDETQSGAGSGGDPLPLLAFALRQLYDRRAGRSRITLMDYERTGGIVGALRTAADAVYDRFQRRGDEDLAISTLLALVHLEPDREPTSRSVRRPHFDAAGWEVIDAFREAHLLTTQGDDPAVSVAHEALLREWPVLERAIERSRDALIERSRLERDAREWDRDGRDASYLVRGRRLRSAQTALAAGGLQTDPVLSHFVVASQRAARREARGWGALIGLGGLVVIAALAGSVLYVSNFLHERARKADARADLVDIPAGARVGEFAIDEHEVTFGQYRQCIREGRCVRPPDTASNSRRDVRADTAPVVMIDAQQAIAFCRWIGRILPSGEQVVRASPRVRHLLDQIEGGGLEWTSTTRGSGHQAVIHDPESGAVETTGVNGAFRDDNLGFRCAAA